MSWKTPLSLVVAIALGLVTTYYGLQLVQQRHQGAAAQKPKVTKVVIAKRDLEPGIQLAEEDLTSAEMPSELVPDKACKDLKAIVGRTIVSTIVQGQTIFEGLLAGEGTGPGLQGLVPKGMRAVTVEVSESSGVAGMLTTGCYVDVIATIRRGESSTVKPIVENVKVIAVDRNTNRNNNDPYQGRREPVRTVTLLVTPKQAEFIALASQSGARPQLTLRGNSDTTPVASMGTSTEDIAGPLLPTDGTVSNETLQSILEKLEAMKAASQPTLTLTPQAPAPTTPVEIIRVGKEKETLHFPEPKKPGEGTTLFPDNNGTKVENTSQGTPKVEAPTR